MARRTFASVWDALEDTAAQAANMRARSELMIACEPGSKAGKSVRPRPPGAWAQPRLNDLMRGRIYKFSLDALINVAGRAGLAVRLQIRNAARFSFGGS